MSAPHPLPPQPTGRPARPGCRPTPRRGFTLLEAVFTVAILAIILAAAVPSYASYLARQRLRHVAELLEQDLRRDRTISVEEGRNIHLSFQSGAQWCWGSSRQGPCDCATGQPRCELGGVSARDHKGTLLQSGQGDLFEAGVGRAQGWTRVGISNDHNHQLYLDLGPLGRPQICGPDSRNAC